MNDNSYIAEVRQGTEHGSFKTYLIGFALSILLTLAAYMLVVEHLLAGWNLVFTLVALGIVQVVIQLLLFLHVGAESKPHWNLTVFLFMLLVVAILVFGSLWIMYSLNERVMQPMEAGTFTLPYEGI